MASVEFMEEAAPASAHRARATGVGRASIGWLGNGCIFMLTFLTLYVLSIGPFTACMARTGRSAAESGYFLYTPLHSVAESLGFERVLCDYIGQCQTLLAGDDLVPIPASSSSVY